MPNRSLELEAKLRAVLSDVEVVSKGGISLSELESDLHLDGEELRQTMRNLLSRDIVVPMPDKKSGRWYMNYYIPTRGKSPVSERLDPILGELGIPAWMDVQLFRGWHVIFAGEYGKKPGLRIIDYGKNPPLIFREVHAGGAAGEILKIAKRSKYKCEKYGKVFWYGYHGRPHP